MNELGIEALVTIGGDGTLCVANRLHQVGIPVIGIPKTIDNDVLGTELTFGFDSATTVVMDALDRLHTTASSHHRVMIVEVMGRHAGWLALFGGVAGGGDVLLIPEIPFNIEIVKDAVKRRAQHGKRFSIVVVAEGAIELTTGGKSASQSLGPSADKPPLGGIAAQLARRVEALTNLETRSLELSHLQRGGSPTAFDRILGTEFGYCAVQLIRERRWGEMVALRDGKTSSVPISVPASGIKKVPLDHKLILAARSVGSCFGD
ncbi:MAG: ATP-dependent 6-phosphofructokinase [bacterium]